MVDFSIKGGDKLQGYLQNLADNLMRAKSVEIGFLAGATYPNGTSVAMVAAIQEYGAPKVAIPPRPFFRTMIKKESPHWGDDIAESLKENDFDSSKALGEMGSQIAGELQQSIVDVFDPPLSPVTIMLRSMMAKDPGLRSRMSRTIVEEARMKVARGDELGVVSTKPLIDTSQMLNSVNHRVVGQGE